MHRSWWTKSGIFRWLVGTSECNWMWILDLMLWFSSYGCFKCLIQDLIIWYWNKLEVCASVVTYAVLKNIDTDLKPFQFSFSTVLILIVAVLSHSLFSLTACPHTHTHTHCYSANRPASSYLHCCCAYYRPCYIYCLIRIKHFMPSNLQPTSWPVTLVMSQLPTQGKWQTKYAHGRYLPSG